MKNLRFFAICLVLFFSYKSARGDGFDPEGWPRVYHLPEAEIAVYMPQLLEWRNFLHLKANAAGDVYVSRDGNIYKKEEDGEWRKREKGGWKNAPVKRENPATLPAKPAPFLAKPTTLPARPSAPPTRSSAANRPPVSSLLDRDHSARQRTGSRTGYRQPSLLR